MPYILRVDSYLLAFQQILDTDSINSANALQINVFDVLPLREIRRSEDVDIMVDEYGMGAFSMVVVENMELKDVQKLEDAYSEIDHVKDVLWYDDVADFGLCTGI